MSSIAMAAGAPMRSGHRGGWVLVAGLLIVMTICHGIITSGLPTLDKAILADLGISRGDLKLREAIFLMSSGLSGLAIGFVTMRVRPAIVVLVGLVLLAATLFAYSHAASLNQIYLLYVVLGLCFASAHVVIVVLMIRERFETRRALATSVALSGTSIGAAIFPTVTVLALEHMNWRSVLMTMAVLPLLVLPVAAALLLRRGANVQDAVSAIARRMPAAPSVTPRRSAGQMALLMIATFGTFFASTAFLLNLFLYLQDVGFSQRMAAAGLSAVFITGLVAKVLVGFSAERWGVHRVWTAQQGVLLVGAALLTTGWPGLMVPGLIALGAGWAGCYVLTQVVIADYFAGPRLAQMTGGFIVFEAIASGLGVWSGGLLFDWFGSYRIGFAICCALVVAALVAGFLFGRRATGA